jgi:hypothetical protein
VYRHTRSITLLNVCAEYIPCEGLERVKFLKLSILSGDSLDEGHCRCSGAPRAAAFGSPPLIR